MLWAEYLWPHDASRLDSFASDTGSTQHNTIQYNTCTGQLRQRHRLNTTQYNTLQYNTIEYNTTQYNTIQYNAIQYNAIQYMHWTASPATPAQHNTIQAIQYNVIHACDTTQYNTIQYNTVHACDTIQCNTLQAQHSERRTHASQTEITQYYTNVSQLKYISIAHQRQQSPWCANVCMYYVRWCYSSDSRRQRLPCLVRALAITLRHLSLVALARVTCSHWL